MKLNNCVFCSHVWTPTDHVIMHVVEEHLEKVPVILRNQILLWYQDREKEYDGC